MAWGQGNSSLSFPRRREPSGFAGMSLKLPGSRPRRVFNSPMAGHEDQEGCGAEVRE